MSRSSVGNQLTQIVRDPDLRGDQSAVIARFSQIVIKRKRNEDTSVVKYWVGQGVSSRGSLTDRDIQVWLDWLVRDRQSKPGPLKASDVYTNEFHPKGELAEGTRTTPPS